VAQKYRLRSQTKFQVRQTLDGSARLSQLKQQLAQSKTLLDDLRLTAEYLREPVIAFVIVFGLASLALVLAFCLWILAFGSAPRDGRAEDIRVVPIVVAEFEFSDVQMQVLFADLVEGADNAALNQRPEAFDCVGVDCADNALSDVLPLTVIDGFVREAIVQAPVTVEIVRANQADLGRYGFIDEAFQRTVRDVPNNASNNIPFALHSAYNGGLFGIAATSDAGFLIPMPVFVAAADVGQSQQCRQAFRGLQ
jgi:hypothetical protein